MTTSATYAQRLLEDAAVNLRSAYALIQGDEDLAFEISRACSAVDNAIVIAKSR